jgi:hypothetical protein
VIDGRRGRAVNAFPRAVRHSKEIIMRKKLIVVAAFAALSAGCGATASSAQPVPQAELETVEPQDAVVDDARSDRAVDCDVRVARSARGVALRGILRANTAASGDYRFVVTKSGGGGSSDISQGGPFALAAGEEAVVGSADLSMERGARWRAVLTLERDGVVICRREARS